MGEKKRSIGEVSLDSEKVVEESATSAGGEVVEESNNKEWQRRVIKV